MTVKPAPQNLCLVCNQVIVGRSSLARTCHAHALPRTGKVIAQCQTCGVHYHKWQRTKTPVCSGCKHDDNLGQAISTELINMADTVMQEFAQTHGKLTRYQLVNAALEYFILRADVEATPGLLQAWQNRHD
jgi:hypothetical protein